MYVCTAHVLRVDDIDTSQEGSTEVESGAMVSPSSNQKSETAVDRFFRIVSVIDSKKMFGKPFLLATGCSLWQWMLGHKMVEWWMFRSFHLAQ